MGGKQVPKFDIPEGNCILLSRPYATGHGSHKTRHLCKKWGQIGGMLSIAHCDSTESKAFVVFDQIYTAVEQLLILVEKNCHVLACLTACCQGHALQPVALFDLWSMMLCF